jgi:very-short-patch-repair endonuclease
LLTSAQLTALGISDFSRRQLVQRGVLRPRARGVWAVAGWPDEWPQAIWVAVLEAGPAAVVFRRTAAAAWGVDGVLAPQPVELALPAGHQSRVKAIHRVPSLLSSDVIIREMLPITTVGRTLADLGSVEPLGVVERAVEWALRNRMVTIAELQSLTERLQTKGGRTLKKMLGQRPLRAPATESDAETLFLQLVRAAGFPDPVRQYWIVLRGRRYRLDFAWPVIRLAVEIDGAAVHGPDELPRDLRRQNQIILDGWLILRFPFTMLTRGARDVESDLWAAWGLRGGLVRPR